jgi:predicted transcriptional regulator YheO
VNSGRSFLQRVLSRLRQSREARQQAKKTSQVKKLSEKGLLDLLLEQIDAAHEVKR